MTLNNKDIQFVTKNVRCPHCGTIAKYRISVEGTTIQAISAYGSFIMGLIFLSLSANLLITEGWKVFGLACIGAILIVLLDLALTTTIWKLTGVIRAMIARLRRNRTSPPPQRELSVRQFTVMLRCVNPDCSGTMKSFQAKLALPIQISGHNEFNITNIVVEA